MIEVTWNPNKLKLKISGHTGTAGESLLCCSVSTIAQSLELILLNDTRVKADVCKWDGYFSAMATGGKWKKARSAPYFVMALAFLANLAEQYPKEIHFSEVTEDGTGA